MIEPPVRHPTGEAQQILARRLGLPRDPFSQDWETEVADPADLSRYLALFPEMAEEDDLRFSLAELILEAFENSGFDLAARPEWTAFLSALSDRIDLHGWQVWYWAAWDSGIEDAWRISPWMRRLCARHFADQG